MVHSLIQGHCQLLIKHNGVCWLFSIMKIMHPHVENVEQYGQIEKKKLPQTLLPQAIPVSILMNIFPGISVNQLHGFFSNFIWITAVISRPASRPRPSHILLLCKKLPPGPLQFRSHPLSACFTQFVGCICRIRASHKAAQAWRRGPDALAIKSSISFLDSEKSGCPKDVTCVLAHRSPPLFLHLLIPTTSL